MTVPCPWPGISDPEHRELTHRTSIWVMLTIQI